jgi:hypothetical protein
MKRTKNVALWMAILMFMMTFQGVQVVWANQNFAFRKLSLQNQKSELQWKLENVGSSYREQIYTLEYYLPIGIAGGESRLVQVELDMTTSNADQKGKATVSIIDPATNLAESLRYIDSDLEVIGAPATSFEKDLSVHYTNSNQFLARERRMSIRVLEYGLEIYLEVERDTVTFATSRMEEGYVIPFELSVGSKKDELSIFTGLSTFEINPVHIKEDGEKIYTILSDTTGKQIPGSEAGIEVKFEMPKLIKPDGSFEPIEDALSIATRIRLEDTLNRTGINETIILENLANGQGYTLAKAGTQGNLSKAGSVYTLYLADKDKTDATIATWSELKPSMLLNGTLEFWEQGNQEIHTDSAQGHTFVRFEIIKTLDGEHMKILPYPLTFPVEYTIQATNTIGAGYGSIAPFTGGVKNTVQSGEEFIVDLSYLTGNVYRILIDGARTEGQIASLNYHYISGQHTLTLDPPSIISIDEVYLVDRAVQTEQIASDKTEVSAGFDITWSARGIQSFLQTYGGSLYYQFYVHKEVGSEEKDLINVTQIALDPNQRVVVKGQAGEEAENKPVLNSNQTITLHNMKLKNYGESDWIGFELDEDLYPPDAVWSEYPLDYITEATGRNYEVPGRYYISMNVVYAPPTGDVTKSNPSYPEPFVLQKRKELIPLPQAIKLEDLGETDITAHSIYFSNISIENYIRYMLTPVKLSLGEVAEVPNEKVYEVYVYQDKNVTQKNLQEAVLQQEIQDLSERVVLTSQQQEQLRQEGGVLRFDYRTDVVGSQNFRLDIEGFSPNQVYYVQLRVRLDVFDTETDTFYESRESLFSNTYSFTTGAKPIPPTPDEQTPPAPKDFFIVEREGNQAVKLGWQPADFTEEELENIHYEIIRVQDNALSNEDLQRTKELEDLLEGINILRRGYKTRLGNASTIHTYESGNWSELTPVQNGLDLRLLDNTLKPNTIYYYYLRTIKTIGNMEVASDWIVLPVTTAPVGRPINLKNEDEEVYRYDARKEVVISFWAPIPADGDVPEDYDFEIAIKGPKDDDFRLDYEIRRIGEEVVDSTYRKFIYLVSDLKPGSRYDVKVRVVDKTQVLDEGEEYPSSLYSDIIAIRTEYDEEDAIRDNKYDEYLKKYDALAEALRRKEYWAGRDGVYKYRTQYIQASVAINNQYILASDSSSNEFVYYMPVSAMYQMNQNKTTLVIELDDVKVYIRPNTLSEELEEIKEAIKAVEARTLKDYYVAISFNTKKSTSLVKGEEALSPEIKVNFDVVYLKEQDRLIDDEMMDILNDLIKSEREDVIDELDYIILERGRLEEDRLEEIIQKAIQNVIDTHKRRVDNVIAKSITKNVVIQEIHTSLLITFQTQAYTVNGYYYDREWTKVYTFNALGSFAIEAKRVGTYIFTGNEMGTLLPEVTGGHQLISKYQLGDLFDVENTEKMKWYATKNQVYGSLARVLGADKNVDPIVYLNRIGIQGVNRIGTQQAIRKDEVIYLTMQTYEKVNNKDIRAIVIRNKQSVSNIGVFQSQYIPYVYAAVELGVVTPVNQKIVPSEGVLAIEVIQILTKITSN